MKRSLSPLYARIPTSWRRLVRRLIGRGVYEGDYASWDKALLRSSGYAHPQIITKAISAARAVRDGQALWDRDTVLFHEPMANAPVLEALNHVAARNDGRLEVVDFGGALGSTWWQHRPWLAELPLVRWSVVEQESLVEIGRREFTVGPLRFFRSMDECFAGENPTVILLSSVLPYIENPHRLLRGIRAFPLRHVIIDRTGFVSRGRDRLTVQRVPPAIYDASYPCWFFDQSALLTSLGDEWRVVDSWVTDDVADIEAEHRGLFLERPAA